MATSSESSAPVVSAAMAGHACVVTLNRPPHNHVSLEVIAALAAQFEAADANPDCRAIILRSEGKHFCAGADLARPTSETLGDAGGKADAHIYLEALRLFRARKPSIAVLQGGSVGAGMALALVADFRIAAADAWLKANFTQLGFHPGMGMSVTLPRLVGVQQAAQLLYTSRRIDAARALAIGLVDEVADKPLDQALTFAAEIAACAPLAVMSTRATLRRTLIAEVEAAVERERVEQSWQLTSLDCAEGIAAASERRAPVFKGR